MNIKVTNKRLSVIISSIVLSVLILFSLIPSMPYTVYASNSNLNFDSTRVLDDLKSSTINDKAFNINDYPFDGNTNPQIINFVEYCYSFRQNMQSNYGLYLYVYNPQGLDFDCNSQQNKAMLAVAYNSDGTPKDYEKFNLKFCSVSTEASYYSLFYKFKIVDHISADGKTILQRVNSNERRYDVSGVELLEKGKPNATDYTVGGTYKFTGYVKGYGADINAESNLQSVVNDLETISLDVRHTNFRTGVSSDGKNHQNELNSVYFSVPNGILEKYGKLQKIKAEWYEYKTAPIVVTELTELYNAYFPYLGVDIGEHNNAIPYGIGVLGSTVISPLVMYNWSYNINNWTGAISGGVISDRISTLLPYLFDTDGVSINNFTLTADKLYQYIFDYDKSAVKGYLPIKNEQISADLFEDSVDEKRIKGYNCVEVDSDNTFNMLSYDSNHSGWEKFWAYFGNWGIETGGDYEEIEPIIEILSSDISQSNDAISKNLYINKDDVHEFKDYHAAAKSRNEMTILFRFAATDYYSAKLEVHESAKMRNKSYMAQQTAFFDFDILTLTFNKEGVYKVIPVVSSPIDIINAVTPPLVDKTNWWQILLSVVLLILLIILLYPFLPVVLNAVIWLVSLPFKLLGSLFKSIGKLFKKRE